MSSCTHSRSTHLSSSLLRLSLPSSARGPRYLSAFAAAFAQLASSYLPHPVRVTELRLWRRSSEEYTVVFHVPCTRAVQQVLWRLHQVPLPELRVLRPVRSSAERLREVVPTQMEGRRPCWFDLLEVIYIYMHTR